MARRGAIGAVALAAALGICSAAGGVGVQEDGVRVDVLGQIKPFKLPRVTPAPIAVFIAGRLGATEAEVPPQLQRMRILVNRHGLLQSTGLARCPLRKIKAASSARAISFCKEALVGSGRFWAKIVLPTQRPFPTRGRLLVFNGRHKGKPALFAHIFTTKPFPSAFVIPFALRRVKRGSFGTELTASFPEALGSWGFVERIKLTLRREYTYRGRRLSYFNAACPALPGANVASFPLARVEFEFAEGREAALTLDKSCGVRE